MEKLFVITYLAVMTTLVSAKVFSFSQVGEYIGLIEPNNAANWGDVKSTFQDNLNRLQREFNSQTRATWLQLESTIGNTLNENPPQHPAVITALMPPTMTSEFSTCFLKKIGLAVNKAFLTILGENDKMSLHPYVINETTFEKHSITNIRNTIDYYFKNVGKAIIALNIDKFNNEPNLLMFHGLCDNYNAVDTRATILFPVKVPTSIYQSLESWSHHLGGQISHEVLTKAWENVVGNNVGPALVARIADAVILLNEGDQCEYKFTESDWEPSDRMKQDEENYKLEKDNPDTSNQLMVFKNELNELKETLDEIKTAFLQFGTMDKDIKTVKADVLENTANLKDLSNEFSHRFFSFQNSIRKDVQDLKNLLYGLFAAFFIIMVSIFYTIWKIFVLNEKRETSLNVSSPVNETIKKQTSKKNGSSSQKCGDTGNLNKRTHAKDDFSSGDSDVNTYRK